MRSKEIDLAIKAAKEAGEFLQKKENMVADSLLGKDIKLTSDKSSEKIIMDILEESGLPVLSEEYGFKGEVGEAYWIIDPLDGTMNYYRGFDEMACVSIALWKNGRPVIGVINRFMVGELFWAEEEMGAFLNGTRIRTSMIEKTDQAVMATGFPVKRSYDTKSLSLFIKQVQCFKKVRMLGAAAIMSTFVACGRFDAYFEDEIMLWDVAAGVAIVNEAGGSSDLELLDDNKVVCKCFSTEALREDFYAKGL